MGLLKIPLIQQKIKEKLEIAEKRANDGQNLMNDGSIKFDSITDLQQDLDMTYDLRKITCQDSYKFIRDTLSNLRKLNDNYLDHQC